MTPIAARRRGGGRLGREMDTVAGRRWRAEAAGRRRGDRKAGRRRRMATGGEAEGGSALLADPPDGGSSHRNGSSQLVAEARARDDAGGNKGKLRGRRRGRQV